MSKEGGNMITPKPLGLGEDGENDFLDKSIDEGHYPERISTLLSVVVRIFNIKMSEIKGKK